MKNYNEMANDVLRRIKESEAIKIQKRKLYVRYVTSLTAMLVVAIVGVNVWNNVNPPVSDDMEDNPGISNDIVDNELDGTPDDMDNQQPSNDILVDKDVIWSGSDYSDNMDMLWAVIEWNGKNISWRLGDAFEKYDENSLFAITALCMNIDEEYIYNGKSLADYETAMIDEQAKIGKLESLRKVGDELKYGTALYLTGTPDGEKWAKELYDETVSWYGEDVLNEYIQSGEFLSEKLENDLKELFKEEAQLEYEIALNDYINSINMNMKEVLEEQNIVSEFSADVDYLLFYATEEEFAKLKIENQLDWLFELAVKAGDGHDMADDVE